MDGDLIIDKGFTVLNNFKPPDAAADGEDKSDQDKSDPIPRYPFASYANAVSMPSSSSEGGASHRSSFLNDCSLVFTARTKEDSEGYSTGSTFFLPCLMKPRCALEGLARAIFRAHVDSLPELDEDDGDDNDAEKKEDGVKKKRLLYDPERSGAEWWTLVLDTPSDASDKKKDGSGEGDDEEDEEEDDEVGMHFDADYGLEEQLPNYTLHPRVATVTYLSDTGVPTLILDKTSPPPSDPEKKSLNGNVNKAWLSHPSFGKHVAFDGRYLHGAPGEYFPSVARKSVDASSGEPKVKKLKVDENGSAGTLSGKRVTFLVNVWLNHCPLESEPLDDEIVDKLATSWEDIHMEEDNGKDKSNLKEGDPIIPPFQWNVKNIDEPDTLNETAALAIASDESASPAGVEDVVICNRHVDIMFGASMEDYHRVSKLAAEGGGSLPIDMDDGVFTLKVGKEVSSDEEDEDDE